MVRFVIYERDPFVALDIHQIISGRYPEAEVFRDLKDANRIALESPVLAIVSGHPHEEHVLAMHQAITDGGGRMVLIGDGQPRLPRTVQLSKPFSDATLLKAVGECLNGE